MTWHDLPCRCLEDGRWIIHPHGNYHMSKKILFCFVFCFVLFCFVLFSLVLFCILFCFVLFSFVLFCLTVFAFSIPLHQLFLSAQLPRGNFSVYFAPIHPRLSFLHHQSKYWDINITTIFAMANIALIYLRFLMAFLPKGATGTHRATNFLKFWLRPNTILGEIIMFNFKARWSRSWLFRLFEKLYPDKSVDIFCLSPKRFLNR